MGKKLDLNSIQWLEKVGRINLQVNNKRLIQLEAVAERKGLDKAEARTSKVVWELLDDAEKIMDKRDEAIAQKRKELENLGIKKWEL